jgi:hypothetical protein
MRPYLGKTLHKNRAGGVAQGEGPEFKPQYCKKKKKRKKERNRLVGTVVHSCNPRYMGG